MNREFQKCHTDDTQIACAAAMIHVQINITPLYMQMYDINSRCLQFRNLIDSHSECNDICSAAEVT
jgi:hypothetical protein